MPATVEFVRGVDFVGVPTHDIAAAASFYGETLGLSRSTPASVTWRSSQTRMGTR